MNITNNCNDYTLVGILSVVKKILELIQIIGPILLMISLVITFTRIMVNPDDKKQIKKVQNSIIATFILFFIPTFVNVVFGMLGESTPVSSCWEKATTINQPTKFMPIKEGEPKKIIPDSKDYEKENPTKKLSSLIYYAQGNYQNIPFCYGNNNVANAGCGVASYAIIASSYVNSAYNPQVVANWFCSHKKSESHGGLSNSAAISTEAKNHFGLKSQVLFDKSAQSSYNYGTTYNSQEGNAMLYAVQQGKSVMFGMPKHWSVVGPNSQCPSNKFYFYNPGRPTSNGCYTPEELFRYTYNYNNHCKNTGWCGWDIAIAFSD